MEKNSSRGSVASDIERRISSLFADIHAKLQGLEKRLKEEATSTKLQVYDNLLKLNVEVESTTKVLNTLLEAAAIKNDSCSYKCNVEELTKQLEKAVDAPCYLLGELSLSSQLIVPEDIFERLEGLVKLKTGTEGVAYQLVKAVDLPQGYSPPSDVDEFDLPDHLETSSIASSHQSAKSSKANKFKTNYKDLEKWVESNAAFRMTQEQPTTNKDNELEVLITHINNPSSFFIQYESSSAPFKRLQKGINEQINHNALKRVRHPEIRRLYITKYQNKKDVTWCRSRLLNIIEGNPRKYNVMFIDYGNTQTVNIESMREMPQPLALDPPYALHCKLRDLYPRNNDWESKETALMAQILHGCQVFMREYGKDGDISEVDLHVVSSVGTVSSMIEFLLFIGHAKITNEHSLDIPSSLKGLKRKEPKFYERRDNFKTNQILNVVISHIISAYEVYVLQSENYKRVVSLTNDMTNFYNNNSRKWNVYTFKQGMAVAVLYAEQWYRAKVEEVIVGLGNVKVFLVDYGIQTEIHYSNIKILVEKFTPMECQSIPIKLTDIEIISEKWETCMLLKEFVRNKITLKMVIVKPSGKFMEAALFKCFPTYELCLNALLVKEEYAIPVGPYGEQIEWPLPDALKKSDSYTVKLIKTIQGANNLESKEKSSKQSVFDSFKKKPVKVLSVKSPDLFYVNFIDKTLEKQHTDLHILMQEIYSKKKYCVKEWKDGDRCAVYDTSQSQYFRAKILCKIDGDNYLVRSVDNGKEMKVHRENIHELEKEIINYPDFAMACSLALIIPAAGAKKWSLTAIDYLQEVLTNQKDCYLSKFGELNNTLPVMMWYMETIPAGPLEPIQTIYHCVNEELISNGLALKHQSYLEWETKVAEMAAEKKKRNDEEDNKNTVHREFNGSSGSVETRINIMQKKNAESVDWNKLIEEEYGLEEPMEDWLPPTRLNELNFKAIITNVDEKGYLYLHDKKESINLEEMGKKMKIVFDKTMPDINVTWKPNYLCTAKYYLDNGWYRAKVLSVSKEEYKVVFIDYGNEEICKFHSLRRNVMFSDIPTFATKVKLHNVIPPNNVWLESQTDLIHAELVDKPDIEVEVIDMPKDLNPYSVVIRVNGTNFNTFIQNYLNNPPKTVSKKKKKSKICHDSTSDSELSVEEELTLLSQYVTKFSTVELPPPSSEKYQCAIVSVLSYNCVIFEWGTDQTNKFEELSEDISKRADDQPILDNLQIGQACVAKFLEDGKWYRAQIYSLEELIEDKVLVWFVDYGNFDSVSTKYIRTILPQWLEYPLNHFIADIHGITLNNPEDEVKAFNEMENLISQVKYVEIISLKPLRIHIYEDDKETLSYQEAIDTELLAFNT